MPTTILLLNGILPIFCQDFLLLLLNNHCILKLFLFFKTFCIFFKTQDFFIKHFPFLNSIITKPLQFIIFLKQWSMKLEFQSYLYSVFKNVNIGISQKPLNFCESPSYSE